jgi:hypothetical protein
MHVASFDDGSFAALKVFAQEMLDLWNEPIVIDGKRYFVVIGQILMDDKGRESFCGVQGATSKAGCNICHFEGRTFKTRQVFDGIRRYLPMHNATRKANSKKNQNDRFHFSFDETRAPPRKRTYAEYREYAAIAEEENRTSTRAVKNSSHKGVKKLWVLDILPYAKYIHWTVDMMHCSNNIITDMLNSLRPTNSGDKKLYQHKNRTVSQNVIEACQEEGIHQHLSENENPPPWIFTKAECVAADKLMHKVIGKCTFEERPLNVMRKGKGNKSHDTIQWAMTFARWCFRDKGNEIYTDNILGIFDILSMLNASRLNIDQIQNVIKHQGLSIYWSRGQDYFLLVNVFLPYMRYYTYVTK